MLKSLILENENKIETFDISYYEAQRNHPVMAAISALETTNEIQKCYFDLEDSSLDFNALKLYALLQSLFVSVDSLYALSISLTKSKNLININRNPVLRELKYIRNDVVGHPANRMFNSTTLAYCILDIESINKYEFSYNIFSGQGIERKKINLTELVENYYVECNSFLEELHRVEVKERQTSNFSKLSLEALNLFDMRGDYYACLAKLKKLYLKHYPTATPSQHRFLWRMELIDELRDFSYQDFDIQDLKEYAIGLEIIKIYQSFSGKEYSVFLGRQKPSLISEFYRFLKKNKKSLPLIDKINDIKQPLLKDSLNQLFQLAKEKNAHGVIKYLNFLKTLYDNKEATLLYAFALPLKDYKNK